MMDGSDGWKVVKKEAERGQKGQGLGITNESSLLFSQLFFSVT